MSVFSLGLVNCEAVQGQIRDNFPVFLASGGYRFTPLLQLLTDPINTNNVISSTISPGDGKKRISKTVYQPRMREADVSTTVAFSCTATNEAGELSTTCEIDETAGVKSSELIKRVDLADICESNDSYIAKRIQAHIDVLHRKLETGLHTKFWAATGKYPDNDTSLNAGKTLKTVQTLKASSVDTSLDAIEELAYTLRLAGYDRAFTIGDNLLTKYFDRLAVGCCVDGYGVDMSAAGSRGITHMHSNRTNTEFGAGNFGFYMPGAAQIVTYNRFAGSNAVVDNSYKQMVIDSPLFPGISFDVTMKEDCGELHLEIGVAYELCTAPTDYFAIDDRLDGFNGILQGLVTNT